MYRTVKLKGPNTMSNKEQEKTFTQADFDAAKAKLLGL